MIIKKKFFNITGKTDEFGKLKGGDDGFLNRDPTQGRMKYIKIMPVHNVCVDFPSLFFPLDPYLINQGMYAIKFGFPMR